MYFTCYIASCIPTLSKIWQRCRLGSGRTADTFGPLPPNHLQERFKVASPYIPLAFNSAMEVDPSPGTSAAGMTNPNAAPYLPKIDEDNVLEQRDTKQKITEFLDVLEGRVEKLRREAAKLEEDRDNILATLDSVRTADWMADLGNFEQDEAHRYIDRIIDRCLTVDIKIHTQRDQPQEESLYQVNHLIDMLVMGLRSDPDGAKEKCVSYMNACASHFVAGMTDKKFESALLGCTLDDQKRVKKRLQGLLSYFDKLDVTVEGD